MNRIQRDLELLRTGYSNAVFGSNNEYFIVPDYLLPSGLFNAKQTRLLVIIPPTYSTAPPDNFYVTWGLAMADGSGINNYSGPTDLHGETWGTFSFHDDGGWNRQCDNFLTFMTAIQSRLQEGA